MKMIYGDLNRFSRNLTGFSPLFDLLIINFVTVLFNHTSIQHVIHEKTIITFNASLGPTLCQRC